MRNAGQLVFIDDSGDPGFKAISSSHFVLAAALFMNSEVATELNNAISSFRRSLGWSDEAEFKFRKTNKVIIKQVLKLACTYDFQIYAAYIRKNEFSNSVKPYIDNEKLYNMTTRDLLTLMPLEDAVVKIDGKYDRNYRRYMRAFIRRELNVKGRRIVDFDASDSRKDNLIQLADLIAGSIHRSFQTDKTDANQYISIIKKKIIVLRNLATDGEMR